MTDSKIKNKFFVFSDESGSWHDPNDVYVRAWVVVSETGYGSLVNAVDYIKSELNCSELKWKILAHNKSHFNLVDKFNFRIFLTVSSPADIHWERKYRVTRDFQNQIGGISFGALDAGLVTILKKKMYDDIRNILFLHFYERTHIENAKKGIERVLSTDNNLLIYRVDPPQMSKDGWKNILHEISPDIQLEFPKSHSDDGIQFADIIAGCIRCFLTSDPNTLDAAQEFIRKIRPKLVARNRANPNPNLIFFDEINQSLKNRSGEIWTI